MNQPWSVNLIIRKRANGDIIRLVDQVRDLIAEYQKTRAPAGLEVSFVNDVSSFVKIRLGVLIDNGIMGMLLVLVSLLLFLSRGIALVAAIGMPVALIGAIGIMHFMGLTINLLTLFALVIVLGMLVDDAIIVAENIWHHYEKGKSAWKAAVDGTQEVFWPVTATILTTLAAFSPLLMVEGIFGKFIESLPKVVVISLIISLIEAMFILPSHAYDVLRFHEWRRKKGHDKKRKSPRKEGGFMNWCIGRYGAVLRVSLKYRYVLLSLVIASLGASWYLQKYHMKTILFPNDGIEFFFIRGDLKPGTSLDTTGEKLQHFERLVRKKIPSEELNDYVTYIGLQQVDNLDPFRTRSSHVGQVGVYLCPESERERTADDIIASIRDSFEQLGTELGFEKVYFERQRLGPPVGKPVAIRVQGHDYEATRAAAADIEKELANLAGVRDISGDFTFGKDELLVKIEESKANRALLSTQDIALHMRAMLEGQTATWVHNNGKRIPVKVRYPGGHRTSVDDLKHSLIMNKGGHLVTVDS